ncbi:hypothetical protein M501DRAFT_1011191 [Patellaria atrata CBS 101060]|uniref:Uncharacterized protein n=1 Tax=Patellaria atrata CBS 101060 TaxID=1346257 RepID=A0A9P4SCI4_9PEZI|nr:hypothetical protein M501DRAFT_1011191 [Patellaria atrata CBS 101060]
MTTSSTFLRFWLQEDCRDAFLSAVDKEDLPNIRLVCHDFATRAAPVLFDDMSITFRASTFTRPARMAALERIGHHVKTVSFNAPHTPEAFLPPLIDPFTGEQREFIYEPQVHTPKTLVGRVRQPKYGSWEITDLLIKQYPPLFHAATNISAFVRAFTALSSLKHLKVSCEGQPPGQRHRRSTVDYALISLRIAIERAPLEELDTLSLLSIHPGALLYLQPMLGFGSTPSSSRKWAQIRKLAIHVDSFASAGKVPTEHLRLLQSYLRTFSPSLTRLIFRWKGERGPSPLTLDLEPSLHSPSRDPSAMSMCAPRPLKFRKLRYLELENAVSDAPQISTFISRHRRLLSEFNFEDVKLRSGSWDEALSPLTRISGNENWKKQQEEVMDVPLILSPVNLEPRIVDAAIKEQKAERGSMTMSKWLGRSKSGTAAKKAKEQFWGSSEHMRKFLRGSMLAWR